MKKFSTLITTLCLILATLALLTSCSSGSTQLPAGTDQYKADLLDFQKANNDTLTAVAEKILADNAYAYYSYYATTSVGESASVVYSNTMGEDGKLTQTLCNDETMLALSTTTFFGDITHSGNNTVVSFRPSNQLTGISFFLVYAKSESDQKYIKKDFLPNAKTVTITPIEGNWYLVMA